MSSKEHKHNHNAVEPDVKAEAEGASVKAEENAEQVENKELKQEENAQELLEAKDQEINRLQEQLKRVTADTENYRKRMDANFERRVDSAKEDIFRKLLRSFGNGY